MRSGGSTPKGNAWENDVCKLLSKWVSGGARTDLFRRNVQSGGFHTVATRRGRDPGLPGDIAANHPDAFPFLNRWMVECKHHKKLDLHTAMWRRTGLIWSFLETAALQAASANRSFVLVAKQNHHPVMCFVPYSEINVVIASGLEYHELWNRKTIAFLFNQLLISSPGPWMHEAIIKQVRRPGE